MGKGMEIFRARDDLGCVEIYADKGSYQGRLMHNWDQTVKDLELERK